jgi:hypothetical protein
MSKKKQRSSSLKYQDKAENTKKTQVFSKGTAGKSTKKARDRQQLGGILRNQQDSTYRIARNSKDL